MKPPAVRLDRVNVAVSPTDHQILSDVSLEIMPGEVVALVGPSGSGKTTILNVIAGLLPPRSGSVSVLGVDMVRAGDSERARLRAGEIGIVFQGFHLVPDASALENVVLPAYFGATLATESRQRARDLLQRVGLAEWADSAAVDLSEGQRQRVAIARALLAHPSLVLADEPTGNLDDRSAETILSLLVEIVRDGDATLILATHDSRCLGRVQRTIRIDQGRIAAL
ncbi:ABC transporter ATP-binding protein [Candidatus Fermentibacteria bacterium]|nr:ABC transporter ATP-binding protein [Candidatus Fermentibacteria bacterium]